MTVSTFRVLVLVADVCLQIILFIMLRRIRVFKRIFQKYDSEKGQGMVEYGIILAVVAVISLIVFSTEGSGGQSWVNSVNGLYDQANDAVNQIEIRQDGAQQDD